MTASLSPSPKLQFFDANGNPLVGGKVYAFAAGTTTPLDTYTDSTGTIPATHPLTLNSRGECEVWLGSGAYKLELRTAANVVVWTVDNVNTANLSSLTLGTPLAATSGGTGQSAFVVGDLLYATSTTALGRLPAAVANNVLRSAGTGTLPVWGKVVLTTDVSGTLPVANGGTGLTSLTANNLLLGAGASAVSLIPPGAEGNLLTSTGTTWQSSTFSRVNASVFTSGSGTFTIPAGVTRLKVTVVGGGGGSSGAASAGHGRAGGGGGTAIKWLSALTPSNTLLYSVGAGGTAGASTPTNGGNGAASSVSSGTETITTITGNGGGGGNLATAAGDGGTATNGDLNIAGSPGNSASAGASIFSNGIVSATTPDFRVVAVAGNGYGGGAAAAVTPSSNVVGAAGSGGLILFEW
jgi:hypothetical protein